VKVKKGVVIKKPEKVRVERGPQGLQKGSMSKRGSRGGLLEKKGKIRHSLWNGNGNNFSKLKSGRKIHWEFEKRGQTEGCRAVRKKKKKRTSEKFMACENIGTGEEKIPRGQTNEKGNKNSFGLGPGEDPKKHGYRAGERHRGQKKRKEERPKKEVALRVRGLINWLKTIGVEKRKKSEKKGKNMAESEGARKKKGHGVKKVQCRGKSHISERRSRWAEKKNIGGLGRRGSFLG